MYTASVRYTHVSSTQNPRQENLPRVQQPDFSLCAKPSSQVTRARYRAGPDLANWEIALSPQAS